MYFRIQNIYVYIDMYKNIYIRWIIMLHLCIHLIDMEK